MAIMKSITSILDNGFPKKWKEGRRGKSNMSTHLYYTYACFFFLNKVMYKQNKTWLPNYY